MRGDEAYRGAPPSELLPSVPRMGCAAPVLFPVLVVAGLLAGNQRGGDLSAPLLAAGLLGAAALAGLRSTARWRAATALALLPSTAIIAAVARWDLSAALIGMSDLGALIFGVPLVTVGAALLAALGTALARAFVRRAQRLAARLLVGTALSVILAAGTLTAVAARRPPAPTLEQYLASLPVTGRLPPLAARPLPRDDAVPPQAHVAGALHIRRALSAGACALSLAMDKPAEKPMFFHDEYGFSGPYFEPCGAITVLADEPRRLWILAADDGMRRVYQMAPSVPVVSLTADMLSAGKRPPTPYLALAVAALAAALASLGWRGKARFPAEDGARLREGRLEADGAIHFPGDELAPAAPPARTALPKGPVVVLLAADRGPFRGSVEVLWAAAGTLAELRSEGALAAGATALALACLGATPLVMAAMW